LNSKTGKARVFYHYFDRHPDYPADSSKAGRGSQHGQEVVYVFQNMNPNQQSGESDEVISEAMASYWTNFAKFGSPNGSGLPKWPALSDANPLVRYFAQAPHTGPVPSADALKVMDQYFARRRTPEGEAFVKQVGAVARRRPFSNPHFSQGFREFSAGFQECRTNRIKGDDYGIPGRQCTDRRD
jgi:para-nitrobenzyl esterase